VGRHTGPTPQLRHRHRRPPIPSRSAAGWMPAKPPRLKPPRLKQPRLKPPRPRRRRPPRKFTLHSLSTLGQNSPSRLTASAISAPRVAEPLRRPPPRPLRRSFRRRAISTIRPKFDPGMAATRPTRRPPPSLLCLRRSFLPRWGHKPSSRSRSSLCRTAMLRASKQCRAANCVRCSQLKRPLRGPPRSKNRHRGHRLATTASQRRRSLLCTPNLLCRPNWLRSHSLSAKPRQSRTPSR